MSDYAIALITGGMGIAGALLGVLFTYRLSLKAIDRQFHLLQAVSKLDAWHFAAGEFISALAPDLRMLEEDDGTVGNLMDFMRRAYRERHMRAAAKFEHFVAEDRRGAFKAEWQRYCYGQHTPDDESPPREELLFLYCDSGRPPPGAESSTQYVVHRLHALLSYAKDA